MGLLLFGEVDTEEDEKNRDEGDEIKRFFEPEVGEGNGKNGFEVTKDSCLRSIDSFLTFLICPKSNNRATNGHINYSWKCWKWKCSH